MNEENIKNLIKKYKTGRSSLEEEKIIFNTDFDSEEGVKIWSSYAKENKIVTPENLNEKLWDSFEEKNVNSNKNKLWIYSAVASIVLIISIFINFKSENRLSNNEKQALLNEARSMFTDTNQNNYVNHIILESDLVVVYTKTEIK